MTVFRGYMMIVKRNLSMLFLYTGIFIFISLLIQFSMEDMESESFSAVKLKAVVVDKDRSILSRGLETLMKERHDIQDISQDKKSLQEEMFYGNLDYVVEIPQGFEQDFLKGKTEVPVIRRPGDFTSIYADQQLNQFLGQVKMLYEADYTVEESVGMAQRALKTETKVEIKDTGFENQKTAHNYMFQYFPYLYMSVLSYCLGLIMIIFKNRNIKRRILCSAVSQSKQNMAAVLAYGIISIGFWLITLCLPLVMYRGEFLRDANLGLYVCNSFALICVSAGIAMVLGAIAKSTTVISAMVTVFSLGMCFICGVFVPMSMLGEKVLRVNQFLPVYWYVKNNTLLGEFSHITEEVWKEIGKGIFIQFAFAIALTSVGLVIVKMKAKE